MTTAYCVVGNGPIGAALALELASAGRDVTVIGARYGERAMYSAHEDDSRMVRLFHADRFWERLTRANLDALAELERPADEPVFRRLPVRYRFGRPPARLAAPLRAPTRTRAAGLAGYFHAEDEAGGIVDPQRYVALLNARARELGARIVCDVVHSVRPVGGRYRVGFGAGEIECARVVTAAGFHAQGWDEDTRIRAKVLAYVECEAQADAEPYCMVDYAPDHAAFSDVYGFCDYRLADGRQVSKFGFSEAEPLVVSRDRVVAWFERDYRRHPGLDGLREWVGRFHERLGRRAAANWRLRPCGFVTTASGRPMVRVAGGHIEVAGCNGMAAKCCQAVARSVLATLGECDVAAELQLERVEHHARC